jgi:hypothetical protein
VHCFDRSLHVSYSIPKSNTRVRRTPQKRPAVRRSRTRRPMTNNNGRRPIVRAPVAMSVGLSRGRIPQIRSMGKYTRISHSEEFAPVTSTGTGFAVFTYQCNPGLSACFPWLQNIAARYESYKFRRLVFRYGTNAPTSAAGLITLAFDYDALDAAPSTMMIARSFHDKAGGAPWSNWVLDCDLAQGDRLPEKYIRLGAVSNSDVKTYDVGNLQVCVEGISAANVGFLEVEYVVDLFTPQTQDPIGGSLRYGSDSNHLFKTLTLVDNDAVLPFTTSAGQTMTFFESWEGTMTLNLTGTVESLCTCAASGTTGSAVSLSCTAANAAATTLIAVFSVRALPGTILTFSPTATTVTQTDVYFGTAAYAGLDLTITSVQHPSCSTSSSSTTTISPARALTDSVLEAYVRKQCAQHSQ